MEGSGKDSEALARTLATSLSWDKAQPQPAQAVSPPPKSKPPIAPGCGRERVNSDAAQGSIPFVLSQSHLLQPTQDNPQPTAVPPPIAAVAGMLGDRHVMCMIGLPERGKPFIAKRLKQYLEFFHGAQVRIFDLHTYQLRSGKPAGSDENAELLLVELRAFMSSSKGSASANLDHLGASASVGYDGLSETDRRLKHVDAGKVAIIISSDSCGGREPNPRPPAAARAACGAGE